jgi:hypothetical protein
LVNSQLVTAPVFIFTFLCGITDAITLMPRNCLFILLLLIFSPEEIIAQYDAYSGNWEASTGGNRSVSILLKIGTPEKNILYPAQLEFRSGDSSSTYDFLLVKKSGRELAISKNKWAINDIPAGMLELPQFFNGILGLSKDLKGIPTLSLERLVLDPGRSKIRRNENALHSRIISFIKEGEIVFRKKDGIPWDGKNHDRILSPSESPVYFGLLDTVHLKEREGKITISGSKKKEVDIVSYNLNGQTVMYRMEAGKKKIEEEIVLDTGLNIVVFFTDEFGSELASKAKMNLSFPGKNVVMDFSEKRDSGSNFIVAKIYHDKEFSDETSFRVIEKPGRDSSLRENDKMIGSIIVGSQKLTLALWDDAQEDGDSVSISIDGRWIARGFPVKKSPQFLEVVLSPGKNLIAFIPDNLGSIPPNTSVLEIIDGKRRKSYFMESNLGENNVIKIFYDTTGSF